MKLSLKKEKFDIIFCLSEIEHKYNPKKFVEKLKKNFIKKWTDYF